MAAAAIFNHAMTAGQALTGARSIANGRHDDRYERHQRFE